MATIGSSSLRWFAAEKAVTQPDLPGLVNAYSGLMYRVAMSIVRNPSEAEDIVQDAFVRVLQQQSRLNEVLEMRPWLLKIVWNLALDRKRRKRPDQMDDLFAHALIGRETPADQALGESRQMAAVLREIELLPRAEREALLLAAVDELRMAEIGAILGRTESSVRSLVFRARTRLRDRLAQSGEGR